MNSDDEPNTFAGAMLVIEALRADNETLRHALKDCWRQCNELRASVKELEEMRSLHYRRAEKHLEGNAILRADNETLRHALKDCWRQCNEFRAALTKLSKDEGWSPDQVMEIARTALERKA